MSTSRHLACLCRCSLPHGSNRGVLPGDPNALGPADARIWYHAVLIAAATGRSEEAIEHLETALRINPNFHPPDAPDARQLLAELSA